MRYVSSRGGGEAVSFEAAISVGYAPDGGLYVPESLPEVSAADLDTWADLDYAALAFEVLWPFVAGEISPGAFRDLLEASYGGFADPDTVRVRSDFARAPRLAVAELFHGPTFCFKDLGLQVAIRLLSHFATARGTRRTLLVATTGDTGPAALRAAADVGDPRLRLLVFFPDGMVSDLQRRQMTTTTSASTRVATFAGGGDDMDRPIKNLALDEAFASAHGLCGVNSYNIVRPLAQTVHFFWVYLRCRAAFGEREGGAPFALDVVVPTGAMGNVVAATLAKRRGLPLGRLCCATNENDITYRALVAGDFSRAPEMRKTLSDAINIQVPYNFERLLYYARDGDAASTAADMARVDAGDPLTLDASTRAALARTYDAARVDDAATCAALRRFRDAHGYVCDPHTAVAVAGADDLGYAPYGGGGGGEKNHVAVVATAHPCKFEDAVKAALGDDAWRAYEASDAFPAAARALAGKAETPPLRLTRRSRGEPLEQAQARWEAVVRGVLEDPDGLHAVLEVELEDDSEDEVSVPEEAAPPAAASAGDCAIL